MPNSDGVNVVPIVKSVDFFHNFDPNCNFDSTSNDGRFDFLVDTFDCAKNRNIHY